MHIKAVSAFAPTCPCKSNIAALESATQSASAVDDPTVQAKAYRDLVIPAMNEVRKVADALETVVDADLWPLPTYAEMLFLR